jgi:hypothetical protein
MCFLLQFQYNNRLTPGAKKAIGFVLVEVSPLEGDGGVSVVVLITSEIIPVSGPENTCLLHQ